MLFQKLCRLGIFLGCIIGVGATSGCSGYKPQVHYFQDVLPPLRADTNVGVEAVPMRTDFSLDPAPPRHTQEVLDELAAAVTGRLRGRGIQAHPDGRNTETEPGQTRLKLTLRIFYDPGWYVVVAMKPQLLGVVAVLWDEEGRILFQVSHGRIHGSLRSREEIVRMMADDLAEAIARELARSTSILTPFRGQFLCTHIVFPTRLQDGRRRGMLGLS